MTDGNTSQREFWSDQAGPVWVARMAAMDAAFAPVLDGVLTRAALQKGERVFDIGCGAGTSTIEAAARVGETGYALGADISEPLLTAAAQRTSVLRNVSFSQSDAQTYDFDAESQDCMISRFGVMFFEDSTAAFSNMAKALRPGGRMCFATWGAIPQNPWFTLPAQVAKTTLGAMPKSDPDAPGPFALRDPALVTRVLEDAGLGDISVEEVQLDLTPQGTVGDLARVYCEIGPVQAALAHFGADEAGQAAVIEALEGALKVHETPEGLRIPALINFVSARKPA